MRATYRVLGYLIAIEVVIQAAAIAYAQFGTSKFIDGGGTVDKAMVESDDLAFDEIVGYIVHGINGMNVIPLLAIIMLIVSFFAKVPNGVVLALVVVLVVAIQVFLGIFAHDVPLLGLLHGINAFILAGVASAAAAKATKPEAAEVPA
ncbi:MAG: hypothetical protein ACRDOT_06825 [Aeromicrobium sp.]